MPVQEGIPVTRGPLCNRNGVEDSMSSEPARYFVAAFSALAARCPAPHLPSLMLPHFANFGHEFQAVPEALEAIREKSRI
jgi:hypothetical protein